MLVNHIIDIRNQLKLRNVDVDQQWAITYESIINKLYQIYFNPGYNHFWTLENPQDIENQRIHNQHNGQCISIGDIANALLTACSNTDYETTTDEQFLREFEHFFLSKLQVEPPMPQTYSPF
ncbi:hypothetical protein [uncultured Legionella sp.]|uniref:hypothetical protein n=1 Tax=uncultured Legionella sp. TaxID=210934 RepID=UPI002607C847|nr:hypothetical protein [uncultured Legionella sp.]